MSSGVTLPLLLHPWLPTVIRRLLVYPTVAAGGAQRHMAWRDEGLVDCMQSGMECFGVEADVPNS